MVPISGIHAIVLVIAADAGIAKAVAALYGIAGIGLYAASAAAHYKVWEPRRLHRHFQADQSMIMAFIASTSAPVAYAVGGTSGALLFGGMVLGAVIGIVAIWLPFHPPRGFMNSLFLIVAWWPIFFIFALIDGLGGGGFALLLGGGAVFTVGAFVVGAQWPNPNPNVFGYHEIWHVFVIVGNAVHAFLAFLILTGQAPISL